LFYAASDLESAQLLKFDCSCNVSDQAERRNYLIFSSAPVQLIS
jgi:hypothetical protein